MKKLGLLVMPLMAVSLLASCNKDGGDNPGEVKFSLSSDQPIEVVDNKTVKVNVDWTPTDHTIKFESFTYTCEPSIGNVVTFDQTGDPRPMPVTITFEKDITEDISGTLSFKYEDVTAKTKGESEINVNIPKPDPGETYTTIDISIPAEANDDYTFGFNYALKEGCTLNVDWGDGTINQEASHPYTEPGDYEITIDNITNLSLYDMPGHNYATSICLGTYVTSIGFGSFRECIRLTSINIPNNITYIGMHAFAFCSALTSVVIPSGVTSIELMTFNGCSSLTTVDIRGNVTTIGVLAFSSCSSLASINIPDSITSISGDAFSNCNSLIYNEYKNASYLGNETNKYVVLMHVNPFIQNFEINEKCKMIASDAFHSCELTSVNIPNSVTIISGGAFYLCDELTSVNIPNSVTSIDRDIFIVCNNVQYYEYENASYLGNEANNYVALMKAEDTITSCKINMKCRLIANRAFSDCYSIAEVDLTNFTIYNEIPICGKDIFGDGWAILEVDSEEMANKFINSDKGWPDSLDSYHWPGKPENSI